ncbi:16S rRNA (guanine(527)-N(7))-methyltransferase RsmG [Aminipila terrae]|uniref:Ribosomal RNA small subunit methyltransferase G n=1 Tax=Aminipila terrae TaxID=2697030 RepID=A0A6P1MJR1_9FIRM|nr:16S rRNA (guanine(527)-N(7))-methyltransferase RsmG [Aminipila terrae]QHI72268.1 16S rRNA (guanine(527)-N(7))-methyltransferase RsmG [Aminipila terrae]
MSMEILREAFNQLNISCDEIVLNKFEKYMEMVLEWNEKVNLTAITDQDEFIKKHYIDSVICYNFSEIHKAECVIDVGTGGGFPGIPLALIFPEKKFVLMDSLKKRLNIIDDLTSQLGITNVVTLHGRAEDIAHSKEHREKYDLCVSRAVANLATLSEYCLPFIKRGGNFLAYKGVKAEEEIKEAHKAIFLLGGKISREERVSLPGYDLDHNIIVIDKLQNTSAKYPRKAGTPSKEPLK